MEHVQKLLEIQPKKVRDQEIGIMIKVKVQKWNVTSIIIEKSRIAIFYSRSFRQNLGPVPFLEY